MEYNEFINICTSKNLKIQSKFFNKNVIVKSIEPVEVEYMDTDEIIKTHIVDKDVLNNILLSCYELEAFDGSKKYTCEINDYDNSNDFNNFVSDYIDTDLVNQVLIPIDKTSGNIKIKPRPLEGILASKKVYCNLGNIESFDTGEINDPYYTMTVVDIDETYQYTNIFYKPNFSYYLEGGLIHLLNDLTTENITIDIIAKPNIPVENYGQWGFITNIKLNNNDNREEFLSSPMLIFYYEDFPDNNEILVRIKHMKTENVFLKLYLRTYISIL